MLDAWQSFLIEPFGGFLIVFIGTMLLFSEVLVRGRFIFGIIGLLCITVYFLAHLQEGQLIWMGVLFLGGMLLVVADGKFIGDGTIAVLGLILMIVGLAWPAPDILYGISVGAAFLIGGLSSLWFLRFFSKRDMWSKLTLKNTLSSEEGYNSINDTYQELEGKEGIALTRFNPTGTIQIEEKHYSATSDGIWMQRGHKIRVISVSGTHILVEKIEDEDVDVE